MSGTLWQRRAQDLIRSGVLPDDPNDLKALKAFAEADKPFEPYYTLKFVIVELESRKADG